MMGLLATWITRQLVVDGLVSGLIIGMLAMGIVLVYRATRVINFADGNMGLVAASMLALLVINYDWPFWLALGLSILLGTLFGTAMELIVVRRLFTAPRVILLVATVGIAQLAQLIIVQLPTIDGAAGERYPVVVDTIWEDVLGTGIRLRGAQLTVLVVVPITAILLGLLLSRTTLGKTVAASANNPSLARLSGINPKLVSTLVWTIVGLLASLSMVLVSGLSGGVASLTNLGPFTLSRALVAALVAGMVSFPRAVAAGVAIGVAEALLRFNFLGEAGLADGLLLIVVLVAVRMQRRSDTELSAFSFSPKVRPIPEHLRELWWVRHMTTIALGAAVLFAVVLVFVPGIADAPSRQLLFAIVVCFAICGMSVTITTGWAGQLSLSQMAFAGFGALVASRLANGLSMDITVGTGFLGIDAIAWDAFPIEFQAGEVPFLLAIPVGAVLTAGLAAVVGVSSLRARGLDLAVATFVFALAAQQYLFRRPMLSGENPRSVLFRRGDLFGIDLDSQRSYYFLCLAVLLIVLAVVARLRRTGIGRTTIAARDNPDSAEAYTVGVTRTKVSTFALAGGVAGLGGGLLSGAIQSVPFGERFFLVGDSLQLVAMVVIGGLGSVLGPVLGAIWLHGFPGFFDDSNTVALFSSSVGLLIVLMYVPGGLIQIGHAARSSLIRTAERRVPVPDEPKMVRTASVALAGAGRSKRTHELMLDLAAVSVWFDGVVAVNNVDVEVRPGEVVGLIGTNGAGKSTLMNAVGGFVPAAGSVQLLGVEISDMPAPERSRLGLGRTFQAARLFPELTVRETVQVALEARQRTPLVASALLLPPTLKLERRQRNTADELIDFLGLGRYADRFVSELSTGTRRIVELAGLLAVDARVLCLDEPTAGVAQREAEAFGPLILSIRKELDASMLIVEHDMPLIMAVSDRMYCLEAGGVIASGAPEELRNDPAVVASYLGTDDRAIERSDS